LLGGLSFGLQEHVAALGGEGAAKVIPAELLEGFTLVRVLEYHLADDLGFALHHDIMYN
jgi:hypothetical protein